MAGYQQERSFVSAEHPQSAMDPYLLPKSRFRSFLELERMTVHEMRRYARELQGFPLAGREISRSGRGVLLQMLKTHIERLETTEALERTGATTRSDGANT